MLAKILWQTVIVTIYKCSLFGALFACLVDTMDTLADGILSSFERRTVSDIFRYLRCASISCKKSFKYWRPIARVMRQQDLIEKSSIIWMIIILCIFTAVEKQPIRIKFNFRFQFGSHKHSSVNKTVLTNSIKYFTSYASNQSNEERMKDVLVTTLCPEIRVSSLAGMTSWKIPRSGNKQDGRK